MPIRRELRPFYRGPAWLATRRRILERAGGRFDAQGRYRGGAKCENCRRLDRKRVFVVSIRMVVGPTLVIDQLYSNVKGSGQLWRSSRRGGQATELELRGREWKQARQVKVQIGIAHRNGVAGDDRDENLAAWCRWCHLIHDQPQHKQTRSARKDKARPLLQEAM